MAAGFTPSKSLVNELKSDNESEVSLQQQQLCLINIRKWINDEAELNGRSDEEFLLLFLRGCKFDEQKTMKKLIKYYDSRRKIPQWWANRDLSDDMIRSILQMKSSTVLIDKDLSQPSVAITILSRCHPIVNHYDEGMKSYSLIMEAAMRRWNCQMNGVIWIMDCRNIPKNILSRMMSPVFVKNLVNSFYFAIPVRIKGIHFLYSSPAVVAFFKLVRPFLSQKLRKRVHFYSSDLSSLRDNVSIELIPEEYGGNAGTIEEHDDAFYSEVLSYADYIADDNQYGFKVKYNIKRVNDIQTNIGFREHPVDPETSHLVY